MSFMFAMFLSFGYTSCVKDSEQAMCDSDEVKTSTTLEAEAETLLALTQDGTTEYTIIHPEECSDTLMQAVRKLISAIKNYTGAIIKTQGDLLARGEEPDSSAKEILVGLTNRSESMANISGDMKSGDYVICVEGNKLVIGGIDDVSTADAVEYFIKKFIKSNQDLSYGSKNGTLTFSSADNLSKEADKLIDSIKINSIDISKYKIVVPTDGYIVKYIGQLFADYITTFNGAMLEVVTDSEGISDYEIRIGNTSRTETEVSDGKYSIKVTASGLEAVSDSVFGYTEILDTLKYSIFKCNVSEISLNNGDEWTGDDGAPSDLLKNGYIRIMYHNVWGYLNADGSNPVANRSDIATEIYAAYNPDILCFEETSSGFRSNSSVLFNYLSANYYSEICYSNEGGIGNPIFYNTNVLKLLESGYAKSRKGDKGTTWAVFEVISSGEIFGVTNSHFAADTNAGDDAVLGNTYRVEDAETLVGAVETIKTKYEGIMILCGGDYNCNESSDPYKTLIDAGLINVRDSAEQSSTVTPYHGSFEYDVKNGYYDLQSAAVEGTSENAIDHIMTSGSGIKINRYSVLTDSISATTSDHCPHFVDVVFN